MSKWKLLLRRFGKFYSGLDIRAGAFVEVAKRPRGSRLLADHLPYLKQRWQEGCHNATTLYGELQERGYGGSLAVVQRQVQSWRKDLPAKAEKGWASPPSARRVRWWLLCHHRCCHCHRRCYGVLLVASRNIRISVSHSFAVNAIKASPFCSWEMVTMIRSFDFRIIMNALSPVSSVVVIIFTWASGGFIGFSR